ncbi:MAG TPA: hypothetical protein VG898_10730 [Solirubrobacterales bacterium]|nr:hypothetical protein [Solirubrobacterales bacterium]
MRSARRATCRAVAAAALVALPALGASGCETTQEKAAAKQAESKRILEKRDQRREHHAGPDAKDDRR